MAMTENEIKTELGKLIRPPRQDVIDSVSAFVLAVQAGTFDATASAIAEKQARLDKLTAQAAIVQGEITELNKKGKGK